MLAFDGLNSAIKFKTIVGFGDMLVMAGHESGGLRENSGCDKNPQNCVIQPPGGFYRPETPPFDSDSETSQQLEMPGGPLGAIPSQNENIKVEQAPVEEVGTIDTPMELSLSTVRELAETETPISSHKERTLNYWCPVIGCKRHQNGEDPETKLKRAKKNGIHHKYGANYGKGPPVPIRSKRSLIMHYRRVHAKIRPHNCKNSGCNKSFGTVSTLNRHQKKCKFSEISANSGSRVSEASATILPASNTAEDNVEDTGTTDKISNHQNQTNSDWACSIQTEITPRVKKLKKIKGL